MIKIRLISVWGCELSPILQTRAPGGKSCWQNAVFTEDSKEDSDYIIGLNSPPHDMQVRVEPDKLWCAIGEPDIGFYHYLYRN